MDIATVIGLILAFAMMALSVVMGGGNFASFWDTASVLMVFGGTIGAVLICFPLKTVLKTPKVMLKPVFNKAPNPAELIKTLVSLAETARRDGLLALEARLTEIDNAFIKLGVQMAIDGTRAEVIEDVMRTEIESMSLRHKEGKGLIDMVGKYAPAFGMIGTLLGLIIMLGNMSDPSSIGGGMAVALITTLYGAVISNASFLPLSEKLAFLSKQEIIAREITIRGILAIQSGENPRVIEQKLNTFLPPHSRGSAKEGK
ncbi:MAG: motility protein A [Pirellulaceae bacterium]|nr:motility protein A [Pirellulaceae bacterium]